jgi:hypothetical protein
MKALLLLMLLLAGCDVGVGVGIALLSSRSKSHSSVAASAVVPDTTFHVWLADIPDAPTATTQQAAIVSAGGNPDPAVWTELGTGTQTAVFDASTLSGSFNAILIQAGDAQAYHLDAIEILGAGDAVVETASSPTYSDQVTSPANVVGTSDGLTADTTATATSKAFLFTRYASALQNFRFRVNIWGASRGSGDVEWIATRVVAGNDTPGGAAVDAASGTIYVTVSQPNGGNRDIRLWRFNGATGAFIGSTDLVTNVPNAGGSHSVAVDSSGGVYVAMTGGTTSPTTNTNIVVRKYDSNLVAQWAGDAVFDSAFNGDRVEANGIAIDAAGNPIVAGAQGTVTGDLDHWVRKLNGATGATVWTQTLTPPDTKATYFYGVASDSSSNVYTVGNLFSLASSSIETFTRKWDPSGNLLWANQSGDNQSPDDRLQAVAVDGSGNVVCGGFFGTTSQGKNALLLKFDASGTPLLLSTHDGPASGDDEILGVAVEADGTAYAAGYETVTGQGQNMWIRKFDPAGAVLWTRTVDGGFGDDRAVSVMVVGASIVVVGSKTESGGDIDVHLRRYTK